MDDSHKKIKPKKPAEETALERNFEQAAKPKRERIPYSRFDETGYKLHPPPHTGPSWWLDRYDR